MDAFGFQLLTLDSFFVLELSQVSQQYETNVFEISLAHTFSFDKIFGDLSTYLQLQVAKTFHTSALSSGIVCGLLIETRDFKTPKEEVT